MCRHFQIKINFRSPLFSSWAKIFSLRVCLMKGFLCTAPECRCARSGVGVGGALCGRECVCACMSLEHIANLRWKRAVNADLSCPALLCLFRTESERFILKTDNITTSKHTHVRTNTHTHTRAETLAQKRFSVVVHVCL